MINRATLEREAAEGADKQLGELVDGLFFPTSTPTRGLTWRSNAWAQTRSKSCR